MATNELEDLARAVAHWLEYQALINKEPLLSEGFLRLPISDFLFARHPFELRIEQDYPPAFQGRGAGRAKAVDFVLTRPGGARVWKTLIETKYVSKKRSYVQEIFDDLLRLEAVRVPNAESFDRYLMIAGREKVIQEKVFNHNSQLGKGKGTTRTFGSILPLAVGGPTKIEIADAPPPIRKRWIAAAREFNLTQIPRTMRIQLTSASNTGGDWRCYIWQISSSQNRKTNPVPPSTPARKRSTPLAPSATVPLAPPTPAQP